MGVYIKTKDKTPMEMRGGYYMMHAIRQQIAKAWNKPFGDLYDETIKYLPGSVYHNSLITQMNQILSSLPDDDQDIIDFLFMSDCNGKIGLKTIKKIYNLVQNDHINFGLGYMVPLPNQEGVPLDRRKMEYQYDWHYFKTLLQHCIKNHCGLFWE